MEAVAAHALLVERLGNCEPVGDLGVEAVEGGVEAGHLRQVGAAGPDRADGGQVVRLVQGCQRDEALEPRQHVVVDQDRGGEVGAAMDHPVADGERRCAQMLHDPVAHDLLGRDEVGCLDLPVGQDGAAMLLGPEACPCRPDAVDLSGEAGAQILARDVEQLELDARAAGVEDEDGAGHAVTGCFRARWCA